LPSDSLKESKEHLKFLFFIICDFQSCYYTLGLNKDLERWLGGWTHTSNSLKKQNLIPATWKAEIRGPRSKESLVQKSKETLSQGIRQGMVMVHACNPSHLRVTDRRIKSLWPAQAKK
jgi:hypothetical protein